VDLECCCGADLEAAAGSQDSCVDSVLCGLELVPDYFCNTCVVGVLCGLQEGGSWVDQGSVIQSCVSCLNVFS